MRRILIVALVGLSACNGASPAATEERARAIAVREVVDARVAIEDRLDKVEAENRQLSERLTLLHNWIKEDSQNLDSLRKTFNGNVDRTNKAKVARMTAEGACGTERVEYPDGGWITRNKECTLKDLLPPS